ncbi:hypothetical protein EZY14_011615 [Kordia sp. TARA_039_SRF]|nr:hypothetical protein EZY14_011615 [Kordia sp. TARA_039_SRF]
MSNQRINKLEILQKVEGLIEELIENQCDEKEEPKKTKTFESLLNTFTEIYKRSTTCCGEPYYIVEAANQSPLNDLDKSSRISDQMLPPLVVPYYVGNRFRGVYIVAIARTGGPIQNEDLKLFYNFSLNVDGKPQLNLYVSFNCHRNIEKHEFWYNAINFNTGSNQMQAVDLSSIETVEVFLIDEDPETSRGTVTTVKNASGE